MRNCVNAIITIAIAIIMLSACGKKKIESQWHSQPITVDGKNQDWEAYSVIYEEALDIVYGIANDNDALYLTMSFRDDRLARKINTRGIAVWLNSNNKPKKKFGIHYIDRNAVPIDLSQMFSGRGPGNRGQRIRQQQTLKGDFSIINKDTLAFSELQNKTILAAAFYDGDAYCFEFKIPLKEKDYGFLTNAGAKIKVGIEIAEVDKDIQDRIKEEMAERRRSNERVGGPGSSGFGGGGFRGPRGTPGSRFLDDMDAQEIWVSVALAVTN